MIITFARFENYFQVNTSPECGFNLDKKQETTEKLDLFLEQCTAMKSSSISFSKAASCKLELNSG